MQNLNIQLSKIIQQLQNSTIAVIYGGNPDVHNTVLFRSDNPRSWKSYQAVAVDIRDALKRLGFNRVILLEENHLLASQLARHNVVFAWLNSAGVQGLDSSCHGAALLESLGIPYVGHSPMHTTLMDNKHLFKMFLQSYNIKTPAFITWHPKGCYKVTKQHNFAAFAEQVERHHIINNSPRFIVKPVFGRASINVHVARSVEQLHLLCQKVYAKTGHTILIEQYLPGAEYCVSVMGETTSRSAHDNHWNFIEAEQPLCFGQFERHLNEQESIFVSTDARPINKHAVTKVDPHRETEVYNTLNQVARQIFSLQGLYSMISLDFRMDGNNQLYVLEANPKPDLKAPKDNKTSLVAMGLEHIEVDYDVMMFNQVVNTLMHLYRYRRNIANRLLRLNQ